MIRGRNIVKNIALFLHLKGGIKILQIFKKECINPELSFQNWTEIEKITENIIQFNNGKKVEIYKVFPINFKLKSKLEQKSILKNYQNFLKILDSKIQILVVSKKTDISYHIEKIIKNTQEKSSIININKDYIEFIKNIVNSNKTITREFYIILERTENIENYVQKIKNTLENCGNLIEKCEKEEVMELLKRLLNRRIMNLYN